MPGASCASCAWRLVGLGRDVAAGEVGGGALGRENGGFGAGAVALFGGGAGLDGRGLGEAAVGAGVVELEEVAVVVFGDEGVEVEK